MKKQKKKDNLVLVISILVIVLAAMGLMAAVAVYYQQHKPRETSPETSGERPVITIPDVTNPPSSTETEPETVSVPESGGEESPADGSTEAGGKESGSSEADEETEETTIAEETPLSGSEEAGSSGERMSRGEYIRRVNEDTLSRAGSQIVDLTEYEIPSADGLRSMIESYAVPEARYLDGAGRTDGDFDFPVQRRNLSGIGTEVKARYGILTDNASVRAFPTWQKLSDDSSADDPDKLQQTMLSAGEGVIVLHQSEDGIWSFVRAVSYYGWIQTSTIGFCSRDEMVTYVSSENFAVVTVPSVEIGTVDFRMGAKLPISASTEDGCTVRLPQSGEDGSLTILEVEVGKQYVSDGYLELSPEALVSQGKKLLGTNYGWGDSNGYMDCTSLLRAIYGCFGLELPRNSVNLTDCGLKVTDLQGMGVKEKEALITSMEPGTILVVNGHAAMYLGQEDGEERMLHNTTQYRPKEGEDLVRPFQCVITPLTICNSSGVSYMELFLYAVSVDWDQIEEKTGF